MTGCLGYFTSEFASSLHAFRDVDAFLFQGDSRYYFHWRGAGSRLVGDLFKLPGAGAAYPHSFVQSTLNFVT